MLLHRRNTTTSPTSLTSRTNIRHTNPNITSSSLVPPRHSFLLVSTSLPLLLLIPQVCWQL